MLPASILLAGGCGPSEPVYERIWIGWSDQFPAFLCAQSVTDGVDCWAPETHPFSEIPGADVDVPYRAFDVEDDLACGITEGGVPLCWGFEGAGALAETTLDELVAVVSQATAVTWIAADGRAERLRVDRSAHGDVPYDVTRETFVWFDTEPPAGGGDLQCSTATCWGAGGWAALSPGEYVQVSAAEDSYPPGGYDSIVCGLRSDGGGECAASYRGVLRQRWTFDGPLAQLNAACCGAFSPGALDEAGRRIDPSGARYSDKERYTAVANANDFTCGALREGGVRCAYGWYEPNGIADVLLPMDEFVWDWDDPRLDEYYQEEY